MYLLASSNEFGLHYMDTGAIIETHKGTLRTRLTNTPMYTLYGWHKHCFTWKVGKKLAVSLT